MANTVYPTYILEHNCNTWNDYINILPKKIPLLILHVNIRSMLKNFAQLEYILTHSRHTIHLVIITEANIKKGCQNLFELESYNMYTSLRAHRKGGGIIIYAHNSILFTQFKTTTQYLECILGEAEINSHYKIGVCAMYRPPDYSNSKTGFIKELTNTIKQYSRKNDLVLLGDANIDLKKLTPIRNSYINSMSEIGLDCGISQYTRIEKKGEIITKSCIDHVFIRCSGNRTAHTSVVNSAPADHCITGCAVMNIDNAKAVHSKSFYKLDNKKVQEELKKKIGIKHYNSKTLMTL